MQNDPMINTWHEAEEVLEELEAESRREASPATWGEGYKIASYLLMQRPMSCVAERLLDSRIEKTLSLLALRLGMPRESLDLRDILEGLAQGMLDIAFVESRRKLLEENGA